MVQLDAEIGKVLEKPEVAEAFSAQGMVPATSTPEEFGELIAKDAQRWADVVDKGNITPE